MVGASRAMAAFTLVAAGLLAPPAAADHDDVGPELRVGRTYSERIADSLTLLGETVDGHLGQLTFDAVKLEIDGRARRAHLRLAGETRYLSMTIQSDVHFRSGAAAVDAVIDLRVAGRGVRLELPDFEVLPRSYLGEKYVEVRLPLIRGSF